MENWSGMAHRLRRILDENRHLSLRLDRLSAVMIVILGLVVLPLAKPQEQAAGKAEALAPAAESPAGQLYMDVCREAIAGNVEEAMRRYADVVARYPQDNYAGCALWRMGWSRWQQGHYDEAIDLCRRLVREYPEAIGEGNDESMTNDEAPIVHVRGRVGLHSPLLPLSPTSSNRVNPWPKQSHAAERQ